MNKLKRGDEVFVASGKDKGRRGVIVEILDKQKVLVEGINIVKKHTKQSATSKGGIESIEMPIHLCKLAIQDPKTSKPTRVGFKKLEDGKKVRFAKKSGETLN